LISNFRMTWRLTDGSNGLKMRYLTDNNVEFNLSYGALKEDYLRFRDMTDEEFAASALEILHFCCVTAFLKEIPTNSILIDDGIIHELIHLLVEDTQQEALDRLPEIRETFNSLMELK
jgi:hypothetical protein